MKPGAPASPNRGRSYQAESRDLKDLQKWHFLFLLINIDILLTACQVSQANIAGHPRRKQLVQRQAAPFLGLGHVYIVASHGFSLASRLGLPSHQWELNT